MTDRIKFGRRYDPEVVRARSMYPMSRALEIVPPPLPPPSHFWQTGPVLDQGETSECVGYAWESWLTCRPLRTMNGPSPSKIYQMAQQIDGIPDTVHGTTIIAGAKVIVSLGRMKHYVWAYSIEDIRRWVLSRGSVVMGTDWYEGMMWPNRSGFVRPTGEIFGGHAWLIIGYAAKRKAFRAIQSWGPYWGREKGRFWIAQDDLAMLLASNGEGCAAVEHALP